jgi:hypothetical protein
LKANASYYLHIRKRFGQMISISTLGGWGFIQVGFLLSAAMAAAGVAQLENILTRPEAYHLKSVQLQGVATNVHAFPPHIQC